MITKKQLGSDTADEGHTGSDRSGENAEESVGGSELKRAAPLDSTNVEILSEFVM